LLERTQLDATQVATIVQEQFPELLPVTVEYLGGCSQSGPTTWPVLAHRDLAAEHVLCDPIRREIVGIIDWSEIAISDCSVDLAGVFHWGGGSGMKSVLAAYEGPVDKGVLIRARFLAACRGVGDVAFGLETERREYIESGMRALNFCLGGDGSAGNTV